MRLWESGLNSEIAKRAVSERIEKCTGSSVSGRFLTTPQPLTLITLAGAFIILVAGAGLSLLVYLIEVVVSLHKAKKVKRPTVRDTGKRKTSDYSPACVAERSVKCATKGIEDLRVESASAARPEHLEGS